MDEVPATKEDLEDFYREPPAEKKHELFSVSKHKRQAQAAWLEVMNLGLTYKQKKKALEVMSTAIAPWFPQPELLMDFLTDCYNTGDTISLLALSGVFYLIQERNLDYPLFYTKLYSLLDAKVLHSKYRFRFLRLLDTFIGSSHLPAVLVASFMKRLARLSLNAPPAAIVAIIPWFYNIFKKHPMTTFMMHRVPRTEEEKERLQNEGLADPFLAEEVDPMETHAIDSCLWEIAQLQSHYHPNVATIAKIISEQFTKQMYNMEDFLDHSYSSVSNLPTVNLTGQKLITVLVSRGRACEGDQESTGCGVQDPQEDLLSFGVGIGRERQSFGPAVGFRVLKLCFTTPHSQLRGHGHLPGRSRRGISPWMHTSRTVSQAGLVPLLTCTLLRFTWEYVFEKSSPRFAFLPALFASLHKRTAEVEETPTLSDLGVCN